MIVVVVRMVRNNMVDLKKYLLSDFQNTKYKHKSLIEIYALDRLFFDSLNKKGLIKKEAIIFFEKRDVAIRNAEAIDIIAFRKLKYEEIIESYMSKNEVKNTIKHDDIMDEKENVRSDKQKNIIVSETPVSLRKIKCFVYWKKASTCTYCKEKLTPKKVYYRVKTTSVIEVVKHCAKCEIYYIPFDIFEMCHDNLQILNTEEIELFVEKKKKEKEGKAKEIEERKAYIRKLNERKKQKQLEKKKKKQQRENDRVGYYRKTTAKQRREEYAEFMAKKAENELKKQNNIIQASDFVVRRNVFKCRNADHLLINVDATVGLIDKRGNVSKITVPAGYCATCKTFFMMETTYQRIISKGIPICRVTEEKVYLNTEKIYYGTKLAQKSVLMQYGYNVSQQNSLSETQRRKILSILVDNQILTRSEIIGYLDFFINQRKNMYNYETAIKKWEGDKEYIFNYKSGGYIKYNVSGIDRKY